MRTPSQVFAPKERPSARPAPGAAPPAHDPPLAALLRTAGNRATESIMVQRACACGGGGPVCHCDDDDSQPQLRPKLTINTPGDPYEVEADRVAEQVLRTPADRAGETLRVQRVSTPAAGTGLAPPIVHDVLRTPGEPLDAASRAYLEPRFGLDLDRVRVHRDVRAAASARAVGALAYTVGRDIVFAGGRYQPETPAGRRLLAHELTHVVQQGYGHQRPASRLQRVVAPDYLIDEPFARRSPPGAPVRVFFPRNSAVIPAREAPKIDAFKSGPDRTVALTLLGLATEDELAALPTLPHDRATTVDTALGTVRPLPPPFNTAHIGARTVTPGTLAHTRERPNVGFNRAVELLRPGQGTLSPSTPIAPPTPCAAALETAFQAAKTMAFDWIDTTRPEVRARPVTGSIAASLDRFFGNHRPETARRVDHNLGLIRAELASVALPANHNCADPNLPGCSGALAFNSGGTMTICAGYASHTPENRARNIVHEAGHSTAGLRIRGLRNRPRTSDFAYRTERLIHLLGSVDPDDALSNSDSYSMFLMTRRAPGAVTPNLLPTSDPAPVGFATPAAADKTARAVALAQVWIRLGEQGVRDLHNRLRRIGTGNPVPADLGDPRRMDRILARVKVQFPPILAGPTITGDDLLMIAGVLDRYEELGVLVDLPIATSPGATTTLTAVPAVGPVASLTLTVAAAFLAATERARARTVVDKLIALVPTTRISVAMRPNYGAFAESVRNLQQ